MKPLHRHTVAANRLKAQLIASMGGVCWNCGATSPLEIDHPEGRSWRLRDFSFRHRVTRYIAEWKAGTIQLLCSNCNRDLSNRFPHRFDPPAHVVPMIDGALQPF